MALICAIILSYLFGSIPTAYIFGRIVKGVDIRKHGSGNVGATNAFRALGAGFGITVLLLDALKGLVCVVNISDFILSRGLGLNPLMLRVILGLTAVAGHSWTVFLNFKGGKGMAVTLGVLAGLSIKFPVLRIILLAEIALWLAVFLSSRIVSLASIISAITFPIFFIIFRQSPYLVLMSLILSLLIVFRHKSNISRLLRGEESRINFSRKS
ncbi:MAG TPA: glycerol-3-phosphate 1-O-acyltransferase PlsY [Candidatus Omnitrophota bacterium]|nr:glycerol-3-phosphate 1-O-acyltransferase PlsY [Candidatus Omnitrophota bacterium]